MTRIAIVEDNKLIRESLVDFVQTDPECRMRVRVRDGGGGPEDHSPNISRRSC